MLCRAELCFEISAPHCPLVSSALMNTLAVRKICGEEEVTCRQVLRLRNMK